MATERIISDITIMSSHFGELEINPDTIFYFENGMLGFDDLNNFVLITEEETAPFKWLLSIENPDISFPVISPWHILSDYNPGNSIDLETHVLFSVITFDDGKGNITANLKAPIVLNITDQTGEQVILPSEKYNLSHIIKQNTK